MGKMARSRCEFARFGIRVDFVVLSSDAFRGHLLPGQPKPRALRLYKHASFRGCLRTCGHCAPRQTSSQHHAVDAAMQNRAPVITALAAASIVTAGPALAADALPSAIAAYSHYLALMGIVGSLTTERLLLKEDMSEESFDLLATADIVYGLSGLLILVSGYFRATAYAKGWEFYAHEPLFWVKMSLLAVVGSASYFPTIKIVQRAVIKTATCRPCLQHW